MIDETTPPTRLDAYPFQHRLADVMSSPVVTISGDASVNEAARQMIERGFSSLIVDAGDRRYGIVTERDVLKLVASGQLVSETTAQDIASFPLITLPSTAFVYRALGRANRRGIRHIGVTDTAGKLIGVVSSREFLRHRASGGVMFGDGVEDADTPDQLHSAVKRIPAFAKALLQEGVDVPDIALVISELVVEVTQRAIELAEAQQPANALPRRCWILSGAAARGECLLAMKQSQGVIWDDTASDDEIAALQSVMRKVSQILQIAGVSEHSDTEQDRPMASISEWHEWIEHWVADSSADAGFGLVRLIDSVAVAGDPTLLAETKKHAIAGIQQADRSQTRLCGMSQTALSPPIGLLGKLKPDATGRLSVMDAGLYLIEAGARFFSIIEDSNAATATSCTEVRLKSTAGLSDDVRSQCLVARRVLMTRLLHQQLADLSAGRELGPTVLVDGMSPAQKDSLKTALKQAFKLSDLVTKAEKAHRKQQVAT